MKIDVQKVPNGLGWVFALPPLAGEVDVGSRYASEGHDVGGPLEEVELGVVGDGVRFGLDGR